MAETHCAQTAKLHALFHGGGSDAAWSEIESHVQECEECRHHVALLEKQECPEVVARLHETADDVDYSQEFRPFVAALKDSPFSTSHRILAPAAETLGDFRLVGEIARGGMGIVYDAVQVSLCRRVALKTLPIAGFLDDRQRQRFKNEAHAAALLHHPNIVPVHAFGVERGVHYYAMQFIVGFNLAQLLTALRHAPNQANLGDSPISSTDSATELTATAAEFITAQRTAQRRYFNRIADLGRQAADALHFAHEQGVIHRDVKPSNLMLDASCRLWVTDFGLARIESEATLTMSGDIMGTLRYMSPEQAAGKRAEVDRRTDIYSLGATLYELLTLQPLFPGEDRKSVLPRIAGEEPVTPRSINSAIPTDLETIVLKAIAKDPADRYATSAHLSDDLVRFVENRPILARRPSFLDRAWSWSKRYKKLVATVIALSFVLLCALLVGTLVVISAWRSESKQRILADAATTDAQRESVEAQRQRAIAESNFEQALQAVEAMLTEVGLTELENVPHLEPVRRSLLQRAVEFYTGFLKQRGNDGALRRKTAHAWLRVADLYALLGEFQDYERAALKADQMFSLLSAENPADADLKRSLATIQGHLSTAARHLNRPATPFRQSALQLREEIVRQHPENAEYRLELANAHCAVGNAMRIDKLPPRQGEEFFRTAIAALNDLRSQVPAEMLNVHVAHADHWLGACLMDQGRYEEARSHYQSCIALRETLLAASPQSSKLKYDLSHVLWCLGSLPVRAENEDEIEQALKRSTQILTELNADFPNTQEYVHGLRRCMSMHSHLLANLERYDEALEVSRALLNFLYVSRSKFPQETEGTGNIAWCQYGIGCLWDEIGNPSNALSAFRLALQEFELYASELPENFLAQLFLADVLTKCPNDAVSDPARAIVMLSSLASKRPDDANIHYLMAYAHYRQENWRSALDTLEALNIPEENHPVIALFLGAMIQSRLGERRTALEWYNTAVKRMEQQKPRDFELRRIRRQAAQVLGLD